MVIANKKNNRATGVTSRFVEYRGLESFMGSPALLPIRAARGLRMRAVSWSYSGGAGGAVQRLTPRRLLELAAIFSPTSPRPSSSPLDGSGIGGLH